MGSTTDITLQKRSAHDAETRARLSEQLLLRTQEAKKNENYFKRFSDLAPGGLVIMDPQERITYANSQWFTISGHPQESSTPTSALSWTNAILEDDQEFFYSKWRDLISNHISQVIEIRMQVPWEGDVGGSRIKIQRWILASVFPEVSDTGTLLSVMGCKFCQFTMNFAFRYLPLNCFFDFRSLRLDSALLTLLLSFNKRLSDTRSAQ